MNEKMNNEPAAWRPWWRWLVSGLLAFHVAAVFMGPLAFSTRMPGGTSSEFARLIMPVFRPYIEAAYLDHGYAFFAPNPGPSHLIGYKVEFADERPAAEGTFPDLARHRPRLLYHRHFMLSEHLHSSYAPPAIEKLSIPVPRPLDAFEQGEWNEYVGKQDAELQDRWKRDREGYEARWNSFERHLLHAYGGDSVSMWRIEHRLPEPELVRVLKFRLDDESLYRRLTKDDTGERPPTQDESGERR